MASESSSGSVDGLSPTVDGDAPPLAGGTSFSVDAPGTKTAPNAWEGMLSSSSSARIIPLHSSAPSMSSGKAARSLEGTRLGDRYSVLAPIGSGGMGTVYEARDEQTGRIVAIKALKVAPSPTSESFQRFRREALSTSAIRHPHLCQVHELGMANGIPYIVMERLVGETLRARLGASGAGAT